MPPLPDADTYQFGKSVRGLLDNNVIDDSLDENNGTEGVQTGLFANHTGEGDHRVNVFLVQKHVMHFWA